MTVWVWEPLQVWTFFTSRGWLGLLTSKIRTPAMWSAGFSTPPLAQSFRLPPPSADTNSRLPMIVGSPCEVMQGTTDTMLGTAGLLTSQMVKPAKLPW